MSVISLSEKPCAKCKTITPYSGIEKTSYGVWHVWKCPNCDNQMAASFIDNTTEIGKTLKKLTDKMLGKAKP